MEKCLRIMGRLEGLSFLFLLFLAMPLKYYASTPIGVKVLGPLHGILFLGYCACASYSALSQSWSGKKHLLAYLAAVVPFGTFWFERSCLSAPSHQLDKRGT